MEGGIKFYKSDEFVWRTGSLKKTRALIQNNEVFLHTNHLCWYPAAVLNEVEKYKPDWYEILGKIKQRLLAAIDDIRNVNIDDLFEQFTLGRLEDVTSHFFNNRGIIAEVPYNWLHLASWNSVYEALDKDINHNAIEGNVLAHESNDNLVLQKEGKKKIVFIGMENTIYVETKDSILICAMKNVADVKKYTEDL